MRLNDTTQAPANFLVDDPEGGDFYRATQFAMPGFEMAYLIAYQGDERVAVVPYFITNFSLGLMHGLGGPSVRIACVGHPTSSFGHIDGEVTEALLESVYVQLSRKAPIVAYKGFAGDLPLTGYARVKSLPVAVLHPAADYLNSLHGHKLRNDLKRKLKAASAVRFVVSDGLPPELLVSVYRLYLNTHEQAKIKFERLSPGYFSDSSALSVYIFAYLDTRMVGFVQMLPKGERVVGKYMGLDYELSREHEVYFSLYLQSIELANQRGWCEMELGETAYHFKKELGCELVDSWIYFRHRNRLAHALFSRLSFLLSPSRRDLR